MSDTPRTDAKRAEIYRDALGLEYEANELRNFCEQLERDLSAAVREHDEALRKVEMLMNRLNPDIETDHEGTPVGFGEDEIHRLTRERDEARAECERLREAVDGVLAWMKNEQMGQWPYMEGAGFYMDLAEHTARLDAARRAG